MTPTIPLMSARAAHIKARKERRAHKALIKARGSSPLGRTMGRINNRSLSIKA